MNNSALYWLISDWLTAIVRSIRHIFRNADSLITGIVLPIIIMLLFVVVFGGAISTGTAYINYVVPGVIMTCVGYGSTTTAMIINRDITSGVFDRIRTLPIARSSLLVGHVTGSLLRNIISAILVFAVAVGIGFRPNASPVEWLVVAALLALVILAISWLSVIIGLITKSADAASGATFSIMFLPYLSSAFVPVDTLPHWLRGFAENQPITPIIETLRGLLIGTPINDSAAAAVTWALAILLVSFVTAMVIFRVKSRR